MIWMLLYLTQKLLIFVRKLLVAFLFSVLSKVYLGRSVLDPLYLLLSIKEQCAMSELY